MVNLKEVLGRKNLKTAYKQVVKNKGSAGVDGLKVMELQQFLKDNWSKLNTELENSMYQPKPILGIKIPKKSGGERLLGVSTVFDRMIQQAVSQILSPIFESEFSNFSYGFRPNRNAGQAILQAQEFINSGLSHIIDIDLKSFFDLVNHDYMMTLIHRKVKEPKLLKLILKFLRAPIEISGILHKRRAGVPQGSPLSPLLSDIILNELDKELESKGLRFLRYADDFSIFLKSRKSAETEKRNITKFIKERLYLEVNENKSSIVKPHKYKYLGYGFVPTYKRGDKGQYQLITTKESIAELKRKIKQITRKTIPASFDERILRLNRLMSGRLNYFRHSNIYLKLRDIDGWIRNRLRYCIWHDWKKPNKKMRSFIRLGVNKGMAYAWSRTRMGGWAVAQSPMMLTTITIARLKQRGYKSFLEYCQTIC